MSVQVGLLEASWDLMRMNPHIKIYTSMRQEAYANYNSPNKTAISGEVSLIRYTHDELLKILDKLSQFYEKVNTFYEFIGFEKIENLSANKELEDSFRYVYRHTIGRPRDLVSICSKLAPEKERELTTEQFRYIVNSVASTDIVGNVFSEIEVLLNALKNIRDRERFLALLPYNILSLDELRDICRQFNELHRCNIKECKDCDKMHPFCDLYNVGLVGIIEHDHNTGRLKQKFIEPYEMNQFSNGVLPMDSPYYLIHPALHFYIDRLRNQWFGKEYILIFPIIVGNGYEWQEQYNKIIEATKKIYTIPNIETRRSLLETIKNFDFKATEQEQGKGILEKLKKIRSNIDRFRTGMEIIRTIDAIINIFGH